MCPEITEEHVCHRGLPENTCLTGEHVGISYLETRLFGLRPAEACPEITEEHVFYRGLPENTCLTGEHVGISRLKLAWR